MFAVVYLIDPKKQIIVPEKFIFGLSKQNLFNYGKNKRQFRIFWSNVLLQDPTAQFCEPKFNLNLSLIHPPIENEVCYRAQIKYFFGEYILQDCLFFIRILNKHSIFHYFDF